MRLMRRSLLRLLSSAAVGSVLASRDRPNIGLGYRLYGMQGIETVEALRVLAEIGYDGAELELRPGWGTEPRFLSPAVRRDLRRQFGDLGLTLPAVNESLQLMADEATHRGNLERLKLGAELFHDIAPDGQAILETGLGSKRTGWERNRWLMAERLQAWARIAAKFELIVAFKPHAGHAVDTPDRALWLFQQVRSPHIKVAFDYSHFEVLGLTLATTLRGLLPHVALVLAKDSRGSAANFTRLLPGDGMVDYVDYLRLLAAGGYGGFMNVEVSRQIQTRPDYDAIQAAKHCYKNLAPAFRKAGVDRRRHGKPGKA